MSILLSFKLTMPNVGSWNGKDTGAGNEYFVMIISEEKEITVCIKHGNAEIEFCDFGDAELKMVHYPIQSNESEFKYAYETAQRVINEALTNSQTT